MKSIRIAGNIKENVLVTQLESIISTNVKLSYFFHISKGTLRIA